MASSAMIPCTITLSSLYSGMRCTFFFSCPLFLYPSYSSLSIVIYRTSSGHYIATIHYPVEKESTPSFITLTVLCRFSLLSNCLLLLLSSWIFTFRWLDNGTVRERLPRTDAQHETELPERLALFWNLPTTHFPFSLIILLGLSFAHCLPSTYFHLTLFPPLIC